MNNILHNWLAEVLSTSFELQAILPGAGVRRYHRIVTKENTWVVMHAPVDEKLFAFIKLAEELQALGVKVPHIHAADLQQGFLLLTDFGSQLYKHVLTAENADALYQQAFAALLRIQAYPHTGSYLLKPFDLLHYREKMGWFIEFYCNRYLNFSLTPRQQQACERLFDLLIDTAAQQPQTGVHYDFHCRNLIYTADQQVGVLDFQDAVRGPITYDLMSLLRDCYIDWPAQRVQTWLQHYRQAALSAGVLSQEDPVLWQRWCDFSSAQRHIKCIGLFARFHILGHSTDYLIYIPRLLNYLREITGRYPQLAALQDLLVAPQ